MASGPFGDERFLESVGSGVFAELVRRGRTEVDETAAIVHRETDRALQLIASILRKAPAADWQLELDDHDLSGTYVAVEAMNIPFVGPNIPLAGDAEMDDGELDLVLLRDEDRERLLEYVVGRVESASALMPSLDVRRGRRIRMVPPAGWPLRIDDELVELDAQADARAVDILLRSGVVQVVGGRPNDDRA